MIGWFVSKLMSVPVSNKEGVKSMLALIDIGDECLCITCIACNFTLIGWKQCEKGRKYWLAAFFSFFHNLEYFVLLVCNNTLCR